MAVLLSPTNHLSTQLEGLRGTHAERIWQRLEDWNTELAQLLAKCQQAQVRQHKRQAAYEAVLGECSKLLGLPKRQICSEARYPELVQGRMLLTGYCVGELGMSHAWLGLALGRERSTVGHTWQVHQQKLHEDKAYAALYTELRQRCATLGLQPEQPALEDSDADATEPLPNLHGQLA